MQGNGSENWLAPGVAIAVGLGVLVFVLVLNAVVCWLSSSALQRIPAEHRKMEPGMVWLLMIPCVPLVWNFFVFQRIPESFDSYFRSIGRTDVGDCGKQMGLWYSICSIGGAIPILNWIAGPAALVLLIISLVKFNELKNKIGTA